MPVVRDLIGAFQNLIHDVVKRRGGVDDDVTSGISSFVACNRNTGSRSSGLPEN